MKTSGGKGLHLSMPLNTGRATHDETKRFALALGQVLEPRDPKRVTVDMAKAQAAEHACSSTGARTTATRRPSARTRCASANGRRCRRRSRGTRSRPRSTRATPTRSRSRRPPCVERVERLGDLYADTLTVHQELPARSRFAAHGTSTARSRSSPARAAASARRPRCCSRERGCKVACAARATDASPLPIPGTIDETVRRITDAGGDAIAVPTNLADDASIERMVATHDRRVRTGRLAREQRRDHVPRRSRPRR